MIQIDMKMPENCYDCPCACQSAFSDYCELDGKNIEGWSKVRPADCRLKEIKEGQKDKYVAWLEKQIKNQTEKSYPEMVLAIYDAGKAYDAIRHLTTLLEENNDH